MKRYITQDEINRACLDIVSKMYRDNYRPDYIVGITRGGLWPAIMLSHYLDIPMHTLDVRLRDADHGPEHNAWMPEDAFSGKKILVVDDINDTGATFNWIQKDWPEGCHPDHEKWLDVWGNTVRFAALIDNLPSEATVDYSSIEINKDENPEWIVFPYEEWW